MVENNSNNLIKIRNRDSIRISRNIKAGRSIFKLNIVATTVIFTDRDTKQIVVYLPSLELSGYGSNIKSAKEMLEFELDELSKYFAQLSDKGLKSNLTKLGWLQNKFAHKEYSNSYVDIEGFLKNFNIDSNSKIEIVQEEFN